MKLFQSSQDRDFELLSAFLDDELTPAERAKLERRLQAEPGLRSTLKDLQRVQTQLNTLPRVKLPRSFTLKPGMVGQQRRQSAGLLPLINYASVLAATLFAVLIGADLAMGRGLQPLAAPEAAPVAMQAPYDANATSLESVQLTPEASPKLGGESETPVTDTQAFTFGTESAGEPLTGNGGPQGGGGGGGTGPGVGGGSDATVGIPPAVTNSTTQSTDTDLYGDTPTPDGTLRIFADTGTPTAPSPAPVESAPAVANVAAGEQQTTSEPFTPLRIGIAVAGLAFLLLIGVSIFLRRR